MIKIHDLEVEAS